jgi:acyl-CoA dehydrogenase
VQELWNTAASAFGIGTLLTQGAVDALSAHGSDDLKRRYLPNMASGRWTGTMVMTEPQAGSDLGAVRTRAERRDDGSYAITGTKIFITYGEHDLTENIVHSVLARIEGAPDGTKGLSLFLVPKFLANADGSLGARNDVKCIGLEEKLGIHGSPTCTMRFGDEGGATGFLVGEENKGLACMFTMMNNARLHVGMQGVAIAERATQHAIAYARERRQGSAAGEQTAPIIEHPDVRRMLLDMKARTAAARAVCFETARALDLARHGRDDVERRANADLAALLTPVAKAFSTDMGTAVASLGIQVHGGMGYIEETGAAQHLRDARICQIYEGTNGIQAIDLVTRKLALADGRRCGPTRARCAPRPKPWRKATMPMAPRSGNGSPKRWTRWKRPPARSRAGSRTAATARSPPPRPISGCSASPPGRPGSPAGPAPRSPGMPGPTTTSACGLPAISPTITCPIPSR